MRWLLGGICGSAPLDGEAKPMFGLDGGAGAACGGGGCGTGHRPLEGAPGMTMVDAKTAMRLDEIGAAGAAAVAASFRARAMPSGDAKRASECTSAARSEYRS